MDGENNKLKYYDSLNSMTEDVLIKPINFKIGNNSILIRTLISHNCTDIIKIAEENIQGIIGLDIIRRFII